MEFQRIKHVASEAFRSINEWIASIFFKLIPLKGGGN
jgi:hypothetical protein